MHTLNVTALLRAVFHSSTRCPLLASWFTKVNVTVQMAPGHIALTHRMKTSAITLIHIEALSS